MWTSKKGGGISRRKLLVGTARSPRRLWRSCTRRSRTRGSTTRSTAARRPLPPPTRCGTTLTPATTAGHAGVRAGRTVDHAANGFDPTEILRDFDYGRTRRLASGRVLREWDLSPVDKEIEVAPGVKYQAWTYNGRVPGPTLRCHEGERCGSTSSTAPTIRTRCTSTASTRRSWTGCRGSARRGGGQIEPGESFTYEFDASPFGVHLYHCHVSPLASHISRGLYGAFIVDPKRGRLEADELVMVMNGFDTNFDGSNEVYAVNTVGFHHVADPVRGQARRAGPDLPRQRARVRPAQLVPRPRELLRLLPDGNSLEPTEFTDTVIQGQGQRGILEMRFPYPGKYMFHAHVTEFAELGWTGFFEVV